MKIKSIIAPPAIALLVSISLIAIAQPKAKAGPPTAPSHHVVILRSVDSRVEWTEGTNYFMKYTGLAVYNSDSSKGAPTFPNQTYPPTPSISQADAMVHLLNEGFVLVHCERGEAVFVKNQASY